MRTSEKLEDYPRSMTYVPAATIPGETLASPASPGEDGKYIVTTKIMVLALAILFALVFFVICLHIYARWTWSTAPARASATYSFWPRRWRRRSRDSVVVLDSDMVDTNMVVGMGKAAVEAIPTFQYKTDIEMGTLECSICLGQFQQDEVGRTLPNCNHRFHLECIDMWLYSHSTCPLCRDVLEHEEDDSVALNLESSSIQVFRTERISTPRRMRGMEPGDQHNFQQPDEPTESEDEHPREQESANKRADGIPANVLFWGNLLQQQGANSRVVNNAPQPAPAQVASAIERGSPRARNQAFSVQTRDTVSHAARSL